MMRMERLVAGLGNAAKAGKLGVKGLSLSVESYKHARKKVRFWDKHII